MKTVYYIGKEPAAIDEDGTLRFEGAASDSFNLNVDMGGENCSLEPGKCYNLKSSAGDPDGVYLVFSTVVQHRKKDDKPIEVHPISVLEAQKDNVVVLWDSPVETPEVGNQRMYERLVLFVENKTIIRVNGENQRPTFYIVKDRCLTVAELDGLRNAIRTHGLSLPFKLKKEYGTPCIPNGYWMLISNAPFYRSSHLTEAMSAYAGCLLCHKRPKKEEEI